MQSKHKSNIAFETDTVRQRTVSCWVCAPRSSTPRYPSHAQWGWWAI